MTADLATRWAGTVVPSWLYRWLMPAGWVAAVVVSVASDTARCSVTDPTICGPDRTFSLAMIACFASLALWWWQPLLAAAAGLLFLVLELRFDDVAGARLAWTVYGAACALVLVSLVLSRRRQRALAAEPPSRQVMVPAARRVGFTSRLVVAGVLVLVGAAAIGVMRWQEAREDVHLQRAVEQTAVVKSRTDDGDLVLQLPDGTDHTVTMLDDYEPGATIPVLVDPADTGWLRPRAELADYTFWYTVAGCAWALALLFVLRDIRLRRARPRQSWTALGLPVRIEPDASLAFAIHSADGRVLLGFLDVNVDDKRADDRLFDAFDVLADDEEAQPPAALKREWARTLRQYRGEALLVGDVAEGSWPTILLGDLALRPAAPLRAPRRLWRVESFTGLPQHLDSGDPDVLAESAVEAAQEIPVLPWTVPVEPASWWSRPALAVVLIAAPFVIGALASWDEWAAAFAVTTTAGGLIHYLGTQVFYRVIAGATEVRIRAGWFERVLAWPSVDSVEAEDEVVVLETGEDFHTIGGVRPGRVTEVAGVFEALRLRARTGLPIQSASRRIAPLALIEGGYVVVCVLILVLTSWSPF